MMVASPLCDGERLSELMAPADAGQDGAHRGRTGVGGRTDAAAAQAGAGAGDFGVECV